MNLFKTYILDLICEYLFAAFILFIPGIAVASSANARAMEGMELYKKQMFDKASQKFLEASENKPNDLKIYYNLGNSHYKQGKFGKALQNYSRSLDQKSHSAVKQKSAYNLGNTLFRMDKLGESVSAYKKALELDPDDMDAKFNLEFVREQIKKKKQEQQNEDKPKKDQQSTDQKNQNKNQDNSSESPKPQKFPFQNKQEQDKSSDNPSDTVKALAQNMTEEEAKRKLNALTEDLKKFQRKQALSMRSLFTYQGNDW